MKISKQFGRDISCFRWVAALFVVISHLRNVILVDYKDVADKTFILKLFYFFTGLGHEAVIVFFVISGFLVGGSALQKFLSGSFYAKDYIVHRLVRIYIVLIPALLIGFALDYIGLSFFNRSFLYTDAAKYHIASLASVAAKRLNLQTFFGNVFMLQTISVPVFGTNGPLWSLAYEWWYYCLFLGILGGLARASRHLVRILYGISTLLLILLLPTAITALFTVWLLGAALALVKPLSVKIHPVIGYGVLFLSLTWSRISHSDINFMFGSINRGDFVVAFGCFFSLLMLRQRDGISSKLANLHDIMAGFSYTTYLVHFPFIMFTVALLHDLLHIGFLRQPAHSGLFYFFIVLILTYTYSYSFSRLTERYTTQIRSKLQKA